MSGNRFSPVNKHKWCLYGELLKRTPSFDLYMEGARSTPNTKNPPSPVANS